MKTNSFKNLIKLCAGIALLSLFLLSACATGPRLTVHKFSFDGWFDKWADTIDLLEYSYGDQYQMVHKKVRPEDRTLGYQAGVTAAMPIGEFLYVKWRIKATGEVVEGRVDLRNRLPSDMFDHGITFVIDGRELFIYLVTPKSKNENAQPILKTTKSRYHVTYEIYPNNTFNQ